MRAGTQSPSVSESPKFGASSGIERVTRQRCDFVVFGALRSSLQSAAPVPVHSVPSWALRGMGTAKKDLVSALEKPRSEKTGFIQMAEASKAYCIMG